MMVGKRNRLMAYLKKKNVGKYTEVADKLKLRKSNTFLLVVGRKEENENRTYFTLGNQQITLETNRIAKQADASVVVYCGETMVMANICAAKSQNLISIFFH